MADKSAGQQVQELKDLVVGYAKQETVDPLKGLGKYVAFGLGGAILLGTGTIFVGIALLRFLQTSGWEAVDGRGNSRWVPYAITVVFFAIVAGIAWSARNRRTRKPSTGGTR